MLHETLDTNAAKQEGSAMTTVEAREPQAMRERGLQEKERHKRNGRKEGLVEEEQADRKIR